MRNGYLDLEDRELVSPELRLAFLKTDTEFELAEMLESDFPGKNYKGVTFKMMNRCVNFRPKGGWIKNDTERQCVEEN